MSLAVIETSQLAESMGLKRRFQDEGGLSQGTVRRIKRKDSKNEYKTEAQYEGQSSELLDPNSKFSFHHESLNKNFSFPSHQNALLLHAKKQPYQLVSSYQVPRTEWPEEALIKTTHIGLNPIDWKAPDYGFGIPSLPYLAGREYVGQLVAIPQDTMKSSLRLLRKGDFVFSASTDYRDARKAAFQEYVVAPSYNICRIPTNIINKASVSGLGVAFVAAALSLGVCLGANFSDQYHSFKGPDMKKLLSSVPPHSVPEDVREEALRPVPANERPQPGDWIAIWGGSSATTFLTAQLARHLNLRVIKVVDVAKHGEKLCQSHADLLVDSYHPERAIDIIRRVTNGNLRFGVDTVGTDSAELLQRTLRPGYKDQKSHIIGLTGLPKVSPAGVMKHTVPIKLFHDVPLLGEALMVWLEALLATDRIAPSEVEILRERGLEAVNHGLNRMRAGEIAGRRLAVSLEEETLQ